VLIKMAVVQRIVDGEVRAVYRRWKRPAAKAGGRQRTPLGELAITSVDAVASDELTDAHAVEAGLDDVGALRRSLSGRDGTIFRIGLRYDRPDPRLALREDASDASVTEVLRTLARKDARATPWTEAALGAIAAQPGRRAADLAAQLGHDKPTFKRRVRQLKELGLTISLDVGYRLSPRGEAVWAALQARPPR